MTAAVCRACGAPDHPSGCAQDLTRILAAKRTCGCLPGYRHQEGCTRGMAGLQLGGPEPCPACPHPTVEHSREAGVGCLHRNETSQPRRFCPCLEPGTSEADQ